MQPHSPGDDIAILRILDANANRALEGLRVVEEYLRLVLEDAFLANMAKQLRHELSSALQSIPAEWRLAARDTAHDVGTHLTTPAEYRRSSPRDVAQANAKRVEQALRSLEEYSKVSYPAVAPEIERLRYQAYTLAKSVESTRRGRDRLGEAHLYVLVDGGESEPQFEQHCRSLIEAGVDVLQLRDKRLADRELLARARRLRELTRSTSTLLIINDRPDLALLSHADGVHVGQEELTAEAVRRVIGPERLVGVSTHNLEQARQAVLAGADYIGCGPTFPSQTKTFRDFPGCDFLRQVAAEISLPAFAIGGITLDNLQLVQACGISRVAVSAAITRSADPAATAREFRRRLVPSPASSHH